MLILRRQLDIVHIEELVVSQTQPHWMHESIQWLLYMYVYEWNSYLCVCVCVYTPGQGALCADPVKVVCEKDNKTTYSNSLIGPHLCPGFRRSLLSFPILLALAYIQTHLSFKCCSQIRSSVSSLTTVGPTPGARRRGGATSSGMREGTSGWES